MELTAFLARTVSILGVAAIFLAGLSVPAADAFEAFETAAQPRPAPEVRFLGLDGTAVTLTHSRGRVVLLNLWQPTYGCLLIHE